MSPKKPAKKSRGRKTGQSANKSAGKVVTKSAGKARKSTGQVATRAGKVAAESGSKGFTAEERAAMKERAKELNAEAGRGRRGRKAAGESDVLAKIEEMPEPDQTLARRVHEIVRASAPDLEPKTWYGMPAYARDGKVVVFFQGSDKFKSRYATLGFSDEAKLDEGAMWPTSFALKKLTTTEEARIRQLVKRAVPEHDEEHGRADSC